MPYSHLIGRHKNEIDTPALLLYMDIAEENIRKMADYFRDRPCKVRPHMKTHKLPLLARKQMEAGAVGITCAKLGEAQIFMEAGIDRILVANQVVGETKIRRFIELSRRGELIVCVDDAGNARQIADAASRAGVKANVLIEVNVGIDRCGVAPGQPALRLAEEISRLKGLNFRGVMGYEGGVFVKDPDEKAAKCRASNRLLVETRELLERHGFPVEITSAGGTNTYRITGNCPGITDVQVGSYVTMDDHNREYGADFGQAISVMATVISRPEAHRAVTDAGRKVLSVDEGLPVCRDPAIRIAILNEEHGHLRLADPGMALRAGDRIEIVPRHGCTTIPLFDRYFIIRNDRVDSVEEIRARGASQ